MTPTAHAGRRILHESVTPSITPMALYRRLYADLSPSFLYESLQTDGRRGRYSFLGGVPVSRVTVLGDSIRVENDSAAFVETGDVKTVMRRILKTLPSLPYIEPLAGGLIGFFSYDYVRRLESIPDKLPDKLRIPDAQFIVPGELIVFDHQLDKADVVLLGETATAARMDELLQSLCDVDPELIGDPAEPIDSAPLEFSRFAQAFDTNVTREQFEASVENALKHILAGDIFQVVLSQRLSFQLTNSPLDLFSALRETNPSQYMYYLNFDGMHVLGSSPELLAQKRGCDVRIRPLAGTRPRGATPAEDEALEAELRADIKERAEHVMLVDLARNDLGRVCNFGSVTTTDLLDVERYARVMHLVSNVSGSLRSDCDAFDLFEAAFPAGTVSGAPKVRAMEIIDELETTRRGLYAGAIGYFNERGDMDTCIAIRNIVVRDGIGHIQAGAGIVADSQSAREYEETLNKARGLLNAVRCTGGGA